jgi:small subunit ribosomal protein S5
MSNEETQINTPLAEATPQAVGIPVAAVVAAAPKAAPAKRGGFSRGNGFSPRPRGRRERPVGEKPLYDQKVIDIRRVTRVVAGGRRFSFSVASVIGDKNGNVGVGLGKAGDTTLAITKSFNDAKKNMIKIRLTENKSIPREISAKFCASRVYIKPAKGASLIAGSSVRNVLELAGVRSANAKVLSKSKNKINNARAALKALEAIRIS